MAALTDEDSVHAFDIAGIAVFQQCVQASGSHVVAHLKGCRSREFLGGVGRLQGAARWIGNPGTSSVVRRIEPLIDSVQ